MKTIRDILSAHGERAAADGPPRCATPPGHDGPEPAHDSITGEWQHA